MNVHLLMTGHIITISSEQLNYLLEARREFITSGRLDSKGLQYEDSAVTI